MPLGMTKSDKIHVFGFFYYFADLRISTNLVDNSRFWAIIRGYTL